MFVVKAEYKLVTIVDSYYESALVTYSWITLLWMNNKYFGLISYRVMVDDNSEHPFPKCCKQ